MRDYTKEELKWIEQLQKVTDSKPKSLSIFVNESGISVFRGRELPIRNLGIDGRVDHIVVHPKDGNWECGAW